MSRPLVSSSQLDDLRHRAAEFGFDHLSVTRPIIQDPHRSAYEKWVAHNRAGDMGYMTRSPEKRLDPLVAYPDVRSILTLALSYHQGPFPEKVGLEFGRVARYAWGEDYHDVIPRRLTEFLNDIPSVLGPAAHPRVAVDTQPLLERALSASSGLGFVGKNTLLIMPASSRHTRGFHVGSYVFLTEILLDVDIDAPAPPSLTGCGSCTRCLSACPTQAFMGPYELDAGKCLAYLTIENKGWIPLALRSQLGDWVFGCDVCQDVCPFNARTQDAAWPEFHRSRGQGPYLDLRETLSFVDDRAFKERWGKTPLARPKRAGLLRNAAVAAANVGAESLIPVLKERADDAHPIVRGHSLWALTQLLPRPESRSLLDRQLRRETDPAAIEDLRALLEECPS